MSTTILKTPAEWTLRLLLASRVNRPAWWGRHSPEHISEDARLVLEACKALQMSQDQDNIAIDDAMISASAQTLAGSLSHTALLKLSLITWHFDATLHFDASLYAPCPALARFLEQPTDNAIWTTLYERYESHTPNYISLRDFKASHDFLFCPALGSVSNGV